MTKICDLRVFLFLFSTIIFSFPLEAQITSAATPVILGCSGGGTGTLAVSPTGNNQVIVGLASTEITGMSYDGTPLVLQETFSIGTKTNQIWSLALGNDNGGTKTVELTCSGSGGSFMAFNNVDQADPIGDGGGKELMAAVTSTVMATADAGDLVVDLVVFDTCPSSMITYGMGQSELFNACGSGPSVTTSTKTAVGTSTDMSITLAGADATDIEHSYGVLNLAPLVSSPPAVAAIPTLSQWGLILLIISFMVFGTISIKQKSCKRVE